MFHGFHLQGKQTVNCHAQPACSFALYEHAVPLYVSGGEHVSLHIEMSASNFLCAAHFSLYFDRNDGDEESSYECFPCEPIIGQYVIPEIMFKVCESCITFITHVFRA